MTKWPFFSLVVVLGFLTSSVKAEQNSNYYLASKDPGGMAGYLWGVENHINSNPATGLRYFLFQSQIKGAAEKYGGMNRIPDSEWQSIRQKNNEISKLLAERQKNANGLYEFNKDLKDAIADLGGLGGGLLGNTLSPLGGALGTILGKGAAKYATGAFENYVAGEKQLGAQSDYSNSLNINFNPPWVTAQFKSECEKDPKCVSAHDGLFAPVMGNSSITDSFEKRLSKDNVMGQSRSMVILGQKLDRVEKELAKAATPEQVRNILEKELGVLREDVAQNVVKLLEQRQKILEQQREAQRTFSDMTIDDTKAAFNLGEAVAFSLGNPQVGTAISKVGGLAVGFMETLSRWQDKKLSDFAMGANTFVLALNCFQFITTLGMSQGPSPEEQIMNMLVHISKQIQDMYDTMVASFRDVNANMTLLFNGVSTQISILDNKADLILGNVEESNRLLRNSIREDFIRDDKWSLSHLRDLRKSCLSGPLSSQTDFNNCRDNFINLAVEKSKYNLMRGAYTGDPTFTSVYDNLFPYFPSFPVLTSFMNGRDAQISAGEVANPRDWATNSVMYMNLVVANKKKAGTYRDVVSTLDQLIAAGQNTRDALTAVGYENSKLKLNTLAQNLELYSQSLKNLNSARNKVDGANGFGRRYLSNLNQPMDPDKIEVFKKAYFDSEHPNGMQTCKDSPDSNFVVSPEQFRVRMPLAGPHPTLTDAFTNVYYPKAIENWNRNVLDSLNLQFPAVTEFFKLVPTPFIWAHLERLGTLDVCISKYRPARLVIAGNWSPWQYRAHTELEAEIQVRFTPVDSIATKLFSNKGASVLIRSYSLNTAWLQQDPSTGFASARIDDIADGDYTSMNLNVRFDDQGDAFPGILGRWAKTFWESRRDDSGFKWQEAGPRPVKGLPMIANFSPLGTFKSNEPAASNLQKIVMIQYDDDHKGNVESVKDQIERRQEFKAAVAIYLQLVGVTASSLGQINNPEYSIDRLLTKNVLLSPMDFMDLVAQYKGDDAQTLAAINIRMTSSRIYLAHMSRYLDSLKPGDPQKIPWSVQTVESVLDRLNTYRRLLISHSAVN